MSQMHATFLIKTLYIEYEVIFTGKFPDTNNFETRKRKLSRHFIKAPSLHLQSIYPIAFILQSKQCCILLKVLLFKINMAVTAG